MPDLQPEDRMTMANYPPPLKLPDSVTRGATVIIPKGARVTYRGKETVTVRNQTVTVKGALDGYYRERHINGNSVQDRVAPWIYWAGSGGYWRDYRADEEFYRVNGFEVEYNTDDYNWKNFFRDQEVQ